LNNQHAIPGKPISGCFRNIREESNKLSHTPSMMHWKSADDWNIVVLHSSYDIKVLIKDNYIFVEEDIRSTGILEKINLTG
jgi:hypothetical protein